MKALLEVALLFLPSIPAYLWYWPRMTEENSLLANVISYVYVLAGTLWIGRRHYSWQALGVNYKGVEPVLAWGGALILGRTWVILAVDWSAPPPVFVGGRVIQDVLFYFGLVAVTEELLFRGLIYRVLLEWKGLRWAIWGSSVGFVLWHIFGQGPLVGAAMLIYGLIFALLRWRSGTDGRDSSAERKAFANEDTAESLRTEKGGILGLVIVHGLIDFLGAQMMPTLDVTGAMGNVTIPHQGMLATGLALIVGVPLGLWWKLRRVTSSR